LKNSVCHRLPLPVRCMFPRTAFLKSSMVSGGSPPIQHSDLHDGWARRPSTGSICKRTMSFARLSRKQGKRSGTRSRPCLITQLDATRGGWLPKTQATAISMCLEPAAWIFTRPAGEPDPRHREVVRFTASGSLDGPSSRVDMMRSLTTAHERGAISSSSDRCAAVRWAFRDVHRRRKANSVIVACRRILVPGCTSVMPGQRSLGTDVSLRSTIRLGMTVCCLGAVWLGVNAMSWRGCLTSLPAHASGALSLSSAFR
jgi:hypothetical protein